MIPGRIVRSTDGRDKDGFFLVVAAENGYVFIADGKTRRLEKPKRKNPKHLAKTNEVLNLSEITGNKNLCSKLLYLNKKARD